MTPLATYLADRGAGSRLAKTVGISQPFLSQCLAGVREIPPERCPAIERATGGRVTVQELRPDVHWARVPDPTWPHPDGRPCLDVAAPVAQEVSRAAA